MTKEKILELLELRLFEIETLRLNPDISRRDDEALSYEYDAILDLKLMYEV
jgi:hypothetical protein